MLIRIYTLAESTEWILIQLHFSCPYLYNYRSSHWRWSVRKGVLRKVFLESVPPKKVSFPKDPLLPKFFYEIVKEEKLVRDSLGSTYEARFKEDTVAVT